MNLYISASNSAMHVAIINRCIRVIFYNPSYLVWRYGEEPKSHVIEAPFYGAF